MSNELSKTELSRRAELERTIRQTKGAFVACGSALAEIRDAKLYRSTHGTFEAYCSEVWGWTRRRAYQLIDAAEIVKALPEKCEPRFTNERQIRALADVPEDKRSEVLEEAAKGEKLTAKKIKQAGEKVAPEELVDEIGRTVPKDLQFRWLEALQVGKEIRDAGRAWKRAVDAHLAHDDQYKQKHNLSDKMSADIGQLVYELSCAIPHAVCPFCQGLVERCEKCHSRGWVGKHYWTSSVPEKLKKIVQTPTFGEG